MKLVRIENNSISLPNDINQIIANAAEEAANNKLTEVLETELHACIVINDDVPMVVFGIDEFSKQMTLEEIFSFDPHGQEKEDTDRVAEKLEKIAAMLRALPG